MAPALLTAFSIVAIALVFAASLHDIAVRTVPNSLVIVLAIAAGAGAGLDGRLVVSLAAAAIVFVAAALCWRRRWLGGGDVKLLAAASLALPPTVVPAFIAGVAVTGGVLAALTLVAQRVLPYAATPRPRSLPARIMRAERWRIHRGAPLPYACAIAAGYLSAIL